MISYYKLTNGEISLTKNLIGGIPDREQQISNDGNSNKLIEGGVGVIPDRKEIICICDIIYND